MDQHDDALRSHLRRLLSWQDAHADFDRTIEGIPPDVALPMSANDDDARARALQAVLAAR